MRRRWLVLIVLFAIIVELRVRAESTQFTATPAATGIPPPPPPPPRLPPIHYSFPQASESFSATERVVPNRSTGSAGRHPTVAEPRFASARQDIITRYVHESFSHRIYLTASAAAVGCALSSALSFSIFGAGLSQKWLLGIAFVCALLLWIRNNIYAELLRAASMAFLLSWQRWQRIRRLYPTGRYLYAAVMRGSQRRPFPTGPNEEEDFALLPTCVAMAVLGAAAVPGNIPLLPTSLVRVVAAILVGYTTTLPTRSGDLSRCLGMRVMMWLQDWRSISRQVELPRKTGVVVSALLDRALILDRQHRLRHRLAAAVTHGVAALRRMQASNGRAAPTTTATKAEEEMEYDDGSRPRRRRSDVFPPQRRDEPTNDFRSDEKNIEQRRRRSGYDNELEDDARRRWNDEYYSNRSRNRSYQERR